VTTGTEQPRKAASRKPDRADAEAELMAAAVRLLKRDGVLVGLNMQEVANEAGLNRGLIHHYFGSRRSLLRAGIARSIEDVMPVHETWRHRSPKKKRLAHFREYCSKHFFPHMTALLALDGDESLEPIAFAKERLEDFEREQAEGYFADDVDLPAMLAVWEASLIGYSVIREAASRQLGIPLATLDKRVLAMLERQQGALAGPAEEPA
jgi:AcrR family transcriptional regulator